MKSATGKTHISGITILVITWRLALGTTLIFLTHSPFSQIADAQVLYGTVVGTVRDSSGAVVPGAVVTLVHQETKDTRVATTRDDGAYVLPTVPTGTYLVTITKQGFKAFQSKDVAVTLNTEVRIDAPLEVGQANETVSVSADEALLQTDRADVHGQVTNQELETLPQPTRVYQGLIGLMPGVPPPVEFTGVTNNPMRSMLIQANGTSGAGANVRIDGVSAQNPWVQYYSSAVPSIEAIQTVNVVTSSSGADQGMVNGASINVQLKSGTNELHGSLYLYHIDNLLKAKPYFLPAGRGLPKLIDNNPGGTIGGPIIHNRLFFFASYEGDFLHNGFSNVVTVPTLAIRSGDMSASSTPIYDPTTGNPDGTGRKPFLGNIIPASRISPISQKVVALIPAPNIPGTNLVNNYFVNTPQYYKLQRVDSKVDYIATQKWHFFGRFSDYPYASVRATTFGPILSGQNANAYENGNLYDVSFGGTYIPTTHLVFDFVYGLSHIVQNYGPPQAGTRYGSDVLGIPGTNLGDLPYAGGFPRFNASGYDGYGMNFPAAHYNDPTYEVTGNGTWTEGKHVIHFGMDVIRQHMDHQGWGPTGFTFSGGATALKGGPSPNQFNSFADLLLGLPISSNNAYNPAPSTLRTWQINPYVSDQWQVTQKFTFSIGTGWEYYPVPTRADRGVEFYDFASKQYEICGKGPNPINCGIHVQKTLFSPRGGIAYRLTKSDVLRAGYSLNPEQINMSRDGLTSYPVSLSGAFNGINSYSPATTLAQGIPILTPPDISSGIVPLPRGVTFVTSPKNFIRGYTQSYNLTVEHQFRGSWIAQLGYVGSHTTHQHTRYNVNYGLPGGGAASQPFFNGTLGTGITGAETVIYPVERMNYNSLQSTFQHRFSEGSSFQVGYTWSKWMGTCCDANADGAPLIPIPQYAYLTYAEMPNDRTHNLHISGVAALPFGPNRPFLSKGLGAAIAGGWQLNAILSLYSGSPFNITADGTSLNAPGSTQRADRIKQNVAIYGMPSQYFDTSAFAPVTTARFGTAGFDSLRGPGFANADIGLFKSFKIHERLSMQARIEVMNVTNTPHFANPNGNASSRAFGSITSTSPGSRINDERYVRLGIRFQF
ncbi:MAG: hypothetical protein NVS9B4_24810 [Candidatus Acidiferrum sp.]